VFVFVRLAFCWVKLKKNILKIYHFYTMIANVCLQMRKQENAHGK
jgi:hypothetical protein